MTVGRSVTLPRATPLPSGVTGNLVSKEERVEEFSAMLHLCHSPFRPVDEKGETEDHSEDICYSRTNLVVISIVGQKHNIK